jgi:hypothetical protein
MANDNSKLIRHNLTKLFDKWYSDNRPKSPNRIRLVQKHVLAPLNDDEEAMRLGQERDRRLRIDRTKKE